MCEGRFNSDRPPNTGTPDWNDENSTENDATAERGASDSTGRHKHFPRDGKMQKSEIHFAFDVIKLLKKKENTKIKFFQVYKLNCTAGALFFIVVFF